MKCEAYIFNKKKHIFIFVNQLHEENSIHNRTSFMKWDYFNVKMTLNFIVDEKIYF